MNAFKGVLVWITLAAGSLTVLTAWAGSAAEGPGLISVVSSQLKWADAPSVGPGAKIAVIEGDLKAAAPFTFRLKLPPNLKIGVHTHPVFERVTVISGTFYFATGDKFDAAKAKAYKSGDAVMIPPGMPMYAYTEKGEAILQLHGTGPWGINFLNPEDAPGKKK
ncbi:MAG: cupin domain-containing protein [Deltaproteobacteria bacterium]|nr:cupin domain-containing protein [Deltaproteobacteria bacterium]MBI2179586.1 cupin domain-containing protein [Deltaproteobacteria bacterium]MBI2229305.1 cupin domain-containing protein [Deltaproteobacteria bacterium]MBI2366648.1 cupin domain-containing protein [Deltaproteobacteria bacterium]MBI2534883.1 cupin domain-containing protein [Deltaproteobacteria bacterium]